MTKERFLIPAHGPDEGAVAVAVEALNILCEKHSSDGLVLIPALKHAADTILSKVWPQDQVKALAKGESLRLPCGQRVSMCSPFTLKNHASSAVILALFASKETIEKAEAALMCKAVVVVPWNSEDSASWVLQHTPKKLGGNG